MSDKSRYAQVVSKYRLNEQTNVEMAGLGPGPMMAEQTLMKFAAQDPSGNDKYLDWMLFMAGGGQEVMERTLNLWNGTGPDDDNSLRNQTRADYVDERIAGYEDELGVAHAPVTRAEAQRQWLQFAPRSLFEFVMGDQDVAAQDGYGFFRHWPGKNGLYQKIVDAVRLWDASLSKLKAMGGIELDIYAGWRPKDYSQKKATYNRLSSLHRVLSVVRIDQIRQDVKFDLIYEDNNVQVICPLTVGASLRFGHNKWCTANQTDFARSLDASNPMQTNWFTYCSQGPLIYFTWKCEVPKRLAKIAVHLSRNVIDLKGWRWEIVPFIDTDNNQGGVTFLSVRDDLARFTSASATRSFIAASEKIQTWAKGFDPTRIVLNYAVDLG